MVLRIFLFLIFSSLGWASTVDVLDLQESETDIGLSEEARNELRQLVEIVDRKPAIDGPATDQPVGENAALYLDDYR